MGNMRNVALALILVGTPQALLAGEIRVMTRNQYLGADLAPVISATTADGFLVAATAALEQIAANDFPERAKALAEEIADKRPHLVGLQEVFNFTLNGSNGSPPFRDHLADLLDALAAQGVEYYVAAMVQDVNLVVPIPGVGFVGITDRDVILARGDVPTSAVPVALVGCRASVDGCNYQLVASVDSPVGTIVIERGFVVVDALIDADVYRFANTHLEVRDLVPTNPLSPLIQAAQAFELVSILGAFPNTANAPIIIVGDINSSPEDPIAVVDQFTIVPPYTQLLGGSYTDAWTFRPDKRPGYTCCELSDLSNGRPMLTERIDVIFSSDAPVKAKAKLVGDKPSDRTKPSRLWPSDHAGVFADLDFAP